MPVTRVEWLCRLGLLIFCVWASTISTPVFAEDWPQWMGPGRDNRWTTEEAIPNFPAGGPKVLWESAVAGGYAGPAVAADRVFVTDFVTQADVKVPNFDRREFAGTERVLCLDADSGQVIWQHAYPVTYGISYPAGPRCTPLVDEERVYTLGAEGNLICFQVGDGEVRWQRDLKSEYETKSPLWGYASHPLIDGDKLICVVGGKGSHTIAFDKRSGREIWRYGTASEQGYSPAVIIEQAGVRQLIVTSPDFVAAVNPETGQEYWKQAYGASNGSIIMTPLHFKNYLYVGGYSNRNLMLELGTDQPTAKELFRDKTKLGVSPVNVQPFLDDGIIYGMDQSGELMAVEIPSGERLWTTGQPLGERPVRNGTAFMVKHGDRFLLFCETGELVIAKLSREGYEEMDRVAIIEPTNNAFGRPVAWYPPAYANGRMYVRNDEKCICVELTER